MIDEFRLRLSIKINKFKMWLTGKLIWLANKIDCDYVKSVMIDKTIKIDVCKYVPADGKWHHCAITVDFWMNMSEKKEKEVITRQDVYVDGEKVSREFDDIGSVDIRLGDQK
jgi:hypothetical protein